MYKILPRSKNYVFVGSACSHHQPPWSLTSYPFQSALQHGQADLYQSSHWITSGKVHLNSISWCLTLLSATLLRSVPLPSHLLLAELSINAILHHNSQASISTMISCWAPTQSDVSLRLNDEILSEPTIRVWTCGPQSALSCRFVHHQSQALTLTSFGGLPSNLLASKWPIGLPCSEKGLN